MMNPVTDVISYCLFDCFSYWLKTEVAELVIDCKLRNVRKTEHLVPKTWVFTTLWLGNANRGGIFQTRVYGFDRRPPNQGTRVPGLW